MRKSPNAEKDHGAPRLALPARYRALMPPCGARRSAEARARKRRAPLRGRGRRPAERVAEQPAKRHDAVEVAEALRERVDVAFVLLLATTM